MIDGNEHYGTIIVPETQGSQIPINNKRKNGFIILRPGCRQRKPDQRVILHPKILNLSVMPLCKKQIKLLSKTLKFTPTPKPNIPGIKKVIKHFIRKLR